MTTRTIRDRGAPDPLVRAIARYIEALHRRYPDGPTDLPERDLAITDDMPNMPVVNDRKRPSAA